MPVGPLWLSASVIRMTNCLRAASRNDGSLIALFMASPVGVLPLGLTVVSELKMVPLLP